MNNIKIIFLTMELACLAAVVMLSFTSCVEEVETIKGIYISLFAILAVIFQKEQQDLEWTEEEEA